MNLRSNTLLKSGFCAAVAIGALAATSLPAAAHYTTTRCDWRGCYRVLCDDDGDDCDRASGYYGGYYRPTYRSWSYGHAYGSWGYPSYGYTYYDGDHRWRHHEEDEDDGD